MVNQNGDGHFYLDEHLPSSPQSMADGPVHEEMYELGLDKTNVTGDRIGSVKVEIEESGEFSLRTLWAFMGPGFLVSIAYIDPGNFDVDISSGAQFEYMLIWVLFVATLLGLLLQTLASRMGVVTGYNLAEMCRQEYPQPVVYALWVLAELTVIASDIPEVIGTAIALNLLFGLKLWIGVLVTSFAVLIFLALDYFGVRKVEAFIAMLLGIVCVCFLIEFTMADVSAAGLMEGFVPQMSVDAMYSAVAIIGAVVMPHNLFLHSALVQSRKVRRNRTHLKAACFYNFIESAIALGISFIINMCIVAVAAAEFYPDEPGAGLINTPKLLRRVLGSSAAPTIFAVALLASGQSSTMTGTYAGQFVMEGFIRMTIQPWLRAILTRSSAIVPSLMVALLAGNKGADDLIVLSQVALSILLPFSLVPLLKFTNSERIMGSFSNHGAIKIAALVLGAAVTVANLYLGVATALPFIEEMSGAGRVLMYMLMAVVGLIYSVFLGYLIYKPVALHLRPRTSFDSSTSELDEMSDHSDDDGLSGSKHGSDSLVDVDDGRTRLI